MLPGSHLYLVCNGVGIAASFNLNRFDGCWQLPLRRGRGNHTIRKISISDDATYATVTTVAGTVGATGSANATGTLASFSSPTSLVAVNDTDAYITDKDNSLIRYLNLKTLE